MIIKSYLCLLLYVTFVLGCQSRHRIDMVKVRDKSPSDGSVRTTTTAPSQGIMKYNPSGVLNTVSTLRMAPKDYKKKRP